MSLPDGIRGLVSAAALAAMMSTASAGLLAASTVLTEDLLPRLRGGKQSSLAVNLAGASAFQPLDTGAICRIFSVVAMSDAATGGTQESTMVLSPTILTYSGTLPLLSKFKLRKN
ncbi:sodium:solute symporter family transporter [Pseudomonas lactucae]|uniref:sodium:solute symporter family transporter n=1 Tax=Pseudomonas lactucae TaxID=2813360 RepID=UPI003CC5247E